MVETFNPEIIENTKEAEIGNLLSEFSDEEENLMNEIEANNKLSKLQYQEIVEDMFDKKIIKDFDSKTGEGKKLQEKREKRYAEDYNGLRTLAVEGFIRMVNSGDILIIKNKIDIFNKKNKCNIPYEIIFLVLAESGWKANAKSRVAGGYRQFTSSSARLFGLNPQDRNNKYKSTDAALRHFKQNIDFVNTRTKSSGKTLSDDTKRKYAFWMYNGSPTLVGKGFRGNPKTRNDNGIISNYFKYLNNIESENYVPRILAIRSTIMDAMLDIKENNITIKPEKDDHKKTATDLAFEKYDDESEKLSSETKLSRLTAIENKYNQEFKDGKISQLYLDKTLKRIHKEKEEIENEKEDLKEINQSGTFILEGLDKKEEYKVYSYIIMKHGTPDLLKKRFIEKFPNTKIENLIVTNIDGVEFDTKKEFQKNEMVFIKSKNLDKKQTVEFEAIKKENSEGYKLFRYEVKKGDTAYGISKRFAEWDQKNGNKYTKPTITEVVNYDGNNPGIIEIGDKLYVKVKDKVKKIIPKPEFEDSEQYNSEGFRLFRYTVKQKDTLYSISRKFNERNTKNGGKYKEISHLNVVNRSGEIIEKIKAGDRLYIKADNN